MSDYEDLYDNPKAHRVYRAASSECIGFWLDRGNVYAAFTRDGEGLGVFDTGEAAVAAVHRSQSPRIDVKRSDPIRAAAAVCRREDYERSRAIMDDGAATPATYEEYERCWKAEVAQLEAGLGGKVIVVELIPDEFIAFCERHKTKGRGSFERCLYATWKASGCPVEEFEIGDEEKTMNVTFPEEGCVQIETVIPLKGSRGRRG
jgi:hypothetical protein